MTQSFGINAWAEAEVTKAQTTETIKEEDEK